MAQINRYSKMGIFLIVLVILIAGCQPTVPPKAPAPTPTQPTVTVPKPVEKSVEAPKPAAPVMEEKAPSMQSEIIQSEISETNNIGAIDDSETASELDNLDGFVERI